jgi:hypothetical protein
VRFFKRIKFIIIIILYSSINIFNNIYYIYILSQNFLKYKSKKYKKILYDYEFGRIIEKNFEEIYSYQIQVGDILLLNKNDIVPNICMLIDTSDRKFNESYCLINQFDLNEKLIILKKYAVEKLTLKKNIEDVNEYKKYIKSLHFELE